MNLPYLTINDHSYVKEELEIYCRNRIRNENTLPWEKKVYEFIQQWMQDDSAIIQHSSGTTGKSKKLSLLKKSMIRSAERTCHYFNLAPGDKALLCLPVEYIAGKMMVIRSITCRLNLKMIEPKSRLVLDSQDEIDFCAMVPLQVMNTFSAGGNFPPVHKLIIGGTEITPELEKLVMELPTQAYATYGMAETCSHIAIRKINGPGPEEYYKALEGVSLETDDRGCLVIHADYLPGPVLTNDQVILYGNNRFKWIGRFDNLINCGGIKIVPEELERVISDKTGISCALIGLPDEKLGQRVILAAEKNKVPADAEKMVSELQKLLPRNIHVKIVWVNEVPRNEAFKIDRHKLTRWINQMI